MLATCLVVGSVATVLFAVLFVRRPLVHANRRTPLVQKVLADCSLLHKAYVPHVLMPQGDMQTIGFSTCLRRAPRLDFARELLHTPDGGQVALDWLQSDPAMHADSHSHSPLLLVLHGLTGGSREKYVRLLASQCAQHGWRVVVLIARGLGGVPLATWCPYNAGLTADVRHVTDVLAERFPGTPLMGIGFSLGANVLAKFVGEEGDKCKLRCAVAVSAPLDLSLSSNHMLSGRLINRAYQKHMVAGLVRFAHKNFEAIRHSPHLGKDGLSLDNVHKVKTLFEYDDCFTARVFGYASASEYYHANSSLPFLARARVPLPCVNALDDPVVGPEAVKRAGVVAETEASHAVVVETRCGGHVSFLPALSLSAPAWSDLVATQFMDSVLRHTQ